MQDVLDLVGERGPISASEMELGGKKSRKGWWEWSDAKTAIEWLFWSGQVTSARRRGFERLYDLPQRVIPAKVLAQPTPPPEVRCQAFGDNGIELALVAWIGEAKDDMRSSSRLRFAISRSFKTNGIEMPNPQRDVHVKPAA